MPLIPYDLNDFALPVDFDHLEQTHLLRTGRIYYTGPITEEGAYQLVFQLDQAAAEVARLRHCLRPDADTARLYYRVDPELYFTERSLPDELEIVLDTGIGSVPDAINLIQQLHRISEDYSLPINIRIASQTSSLGMVVLQGAPGRRLAGPYSMFSIHNWKFIKTEDGQMVEDQSRLSDAFRDTLVGIVASRNTSPDPKYRTVEFWQDLLFGQGFDDPLRALGSHVPKVEFYSAQEALQMGLLDEVQLLRPRHGQG